MIIAAPLVLGPVSSVDVRLGDVTLDFDDGDGDAAGHKFRVEGPYPGPSRSLVGPPAPPSTLRPPDDYPFIVRLEGVSYSISRRCEDGPDGIFKGHDLGSGYCLGYGLEPARLSMEEVQVFSDLCPSPSASAQAGVFCKGTPRPIQENDHQAYSHGIGPGHHNRARCRRTAMLECVSMSSGRCLEGGSMV